MNTKTYILITKSTIKKVKDSNLHQKLSEWNYGNYKIKAPIYTTKFNLK